MEIWDILDEQGNFTGKTIVRGETLKEGEYHLVVHIWIVNDKGQYLIQRRADHLKLMPGMWATTGGSSIEGEDSKVAALRETKEELGLTIEPNKIHKLDRVKRIHNIVDVWVIRENVSLKDIKILEEEVSDVRWVTKAKLKEMIKNGDFHNYGEEYFKKIFNLV